MMRTVILIFCMNIGISNVMNGQYQITNDKELEGYQSIPQEYVDIHVNDTFFLSGEYLYYKLYCLDTKNSIPSTVSKIAYVELVGSGGKIVFEHKIKLNKGQGQGDFFIPASTPSGNYKLIGYTRWMLNQGQEAFFETDLAIVNPYKELDESMRFDNKKQKEGSDLVVQEEIQREKISLEPNQDHFQIVLPKKEFRKRKLVNLEILNNLNPLIVSNLSISVRKIDALSSFDLSNPGSVKPTAKLSLNKKRLGDSIFLPELRGELLSGTVMSKDSIPLPGQNVAFSLSKSYPIIKTAITDTTGRFFVNINEEDRSGEFELLVLGDHDNDKRVVLDESNPIDFMDFAFREIKVSPEMAKIILERSVHNQIESAYSSKRNDTSLVGNIGHKFLNDLSEIYVLKDYKRFATLKETIVEIIDAVWIKKEKDSYKIQIRGTESFFVDSNEVPLVFVDGFVVRDINSLLNYDIKKIKSIAVSRDKYYSGAKVFHGILSISTSDQSFKTSDDDFIYEEVLSPPLHKKKYFFQRYGVGVADSQRKYPDYRYQLFWQPELEIKEEKTEVSFYTSDNTGDFEIIIRGYTNDGRPVSLSEIIRVKP